MVNSMANSTSTAGRRRSISPSPSLASQPSTQLQASSIQLTSLSPSLPKKNRNLVSDDRRDFDDTLKFNRRESEVAALRQLTKKELLEFFDEFVRVGASKKAALSVRVYGSVHLSEYNEDNSQVEASSVKIDDIFGFRRSRPLYNSFKGGHGQMKL